MIGKTTYDKIEKLLKAGVIMFDKYSNEIKKLNTFDKKDILNKNFLLMKKDKMEIYYAPHNEIVNEKAKIFIVGITPGWTQTSIAYEIACNGLRNNMEYESIKRECKKNSRFAGSMRKNLIEMLDELKLNEKLRINSCSELFGVEDELLHTTSIIPYPVFINNKNYTGSNPKILDDEVLRLYMEKYFYREVEKMKNTLIIPLGKAVEEVLHFMVSEGLIKEEQCLFGFPHPSGANGHRKYQFDENKEGLLSKVNDYFDKKMN